MSNIKVRVGQQNAIRVTSSISGGTAFADNATNATNVIGGIASVTQLNVSGISTLGFATASQIYTTGIVTAIGGFIGNLTGIASTASFATTSYNLTNAANITTGTIDSARLSGTYNINISGSSSYATSAGIATYSTNSGVATYATNAGTSTSVIGGIASVTSLNVSGISTLGIVTSGNIFSTGIITANSFVKSGGQTGFLKADGSVDSSTYLTSYTETDTLNSVTTRGNSTSNGISVGILTASSGNFSGIVTSSGLRVTGVSTLGIVTSGNIFSTGVVTATSFSGSGANLTGIVTSIIAGTNISISGSNGQVTINSTAIGGGSSLTVYDGYPNLIGVVTSIDFGANLSVTASSGIATVNAAGGGGTGVEIFDDSTDVGFAGTIKFGYGLSASNVVSGITTVDFILNSIGYATTATNVIGGIASVTSLNVSGLSTLGIVTAGNIYSTGVVTATSFVRSGGTSSQFLKADGTVDSSTYLTSYTETDTLNSVTTRGNSTSNGISVGILTASSGNFSGIVTSSSAVISGITTSNGFNATAGNDYKIGSISVLTSTTLGSGVTNSSLTSVGTLTNLSVGNINSTGILTASSGNFSGIVTSSGLRVTGVSTLGIVTAENIYSTGVITATSFSGNASSATALQNPKNFSITGNFVTAPAISFDGTGNVALAATISSKSIGLGTYTTGDYVKSISGTVNQITVTGGTGEGSTPTISIPSNPTLPGNVTIGNDLQVNNNLNVTGNITIGGTAAYIISNDFRVKDADIVLGYTTSITGADASTDTTANHGGIAIASTEGSPLVTLYNVSIGETNPATYKKIMWFKSGSFTGLNTDAWLINYAVGIGSTQFPSGTRLAAGNVQFTQNDLAVVGNINASGIVTATSFSGNATSASSAIYATNAGTSTSVIGGIASVTSLNVSGISTLGIVTSGNIFSTGVVTATSFVKSGGQTGFLKADGSVDSSTYLTTTGSGTNLTGIVTSITAGSGISVNQSTGNVTITATGGSGTNYWVSTAAGIHTLSNVGIGTTNPTTKLDVSGVIRSGRVDTGNEGGQVELARSTDNATAWYLDVFGNTSTPSFRIVDATAAAARLTIDSTGKITGDGSGLTGIIAAGSGVVVRDDGDPVGTAGTIDFGANLSVTFAAGIATVNSTAVGGGSSLTVYDGYPNTIGVVTSLDFSSGLLVSPVSSGIATVTQNLGMMVAATYNMLMP